LIDYEYIYNRGVGGDRKVEERIGFWSGSNRGRKL